MKKFILFFLFFSSAIILSNAQVIDLIGKGTFGQTSSNLSFSDLDNLNHVHVGSVYKGPLLDPIPLNGVAFNDLDESPTSIWNDNFTDTNPNSNRTRGYYSAIFNTFDTDGIDANFSISNIHSYYAFIYRDILTSTFKSSASLETVFMYHNGSNEPFVYNIAIDSDSDMRNIKVKIPITELDEKGRMVIIDIDAGPKTHHAEENTYNFGNSLFLGEYTITNVPGDVTNVTISIYSPDPIVDGRDGDSFFIGGVVVDVDKVGCTLTQGYWKNHSTCKAKGPKRDDTWSDIPGGEAEETVFFLSEQDYCQVFDTNPGKGGKYYILAHQYIAAQLNLLAGANPTDVADAFNEATEFLKDHTQDTVEGNKDLEKKCVELGGILDDFNNGRIGPGHCDDNDDDVSIEPIKQVVSKKVAIYPNPATTYGKIEFTSKQSAITIVELYNVNGQKVGILFNKKTTKGSPVSIQFDTQQFKRGLYFAIIKNGSDVYKEKISILK